jgi:hypothetical protein
LTPERATALREQLWRSGFRPVALYNHDDPGPSPGKRPVGQGWQRDARCDPPLWAARPAQPSSVNTGVLTDGLRAVDLDIDDLAVAESCTGIANEVLGPAPVRFRRNSSRRLLLYRAAQGAPSKRSVAGQFGKIEVLGKGQQFVAFGTHDTGVEIEWLSESPGLITLDDLPVVTEGQITEFLTRCAAIIGASSPKANGHDEWFDPGPAPADEADLRARIAASGEGTHDALVSLAGLLARRGADSDELTSTLTDALQQRPLAARNPDWHRHLADVPRLVQWVLRKEHERCADDPDDPWAPPRAEAVEPEEIEPKPEEWPEPMTMAAYHGLLGEAVAEIMPHTEADAHALLLQLIVMLGNKIGRGPYFRVGQSQHATNLYALLAGNSSRSRKGTSENEVRALFASDPADHWLLSCIQAGLSTGEGLVNAVRDERWGKNKNGEPELLDEGVSDKRLLSVESEFASVLAVMKREANTLSSVLRVAWDRGTLQTMTRNAPLKATGTLISVIGHITVDELRAGVDRISISNGLLNRFLFAAVKRSRLLPHGGNVDQDRLHQIADRLNEAVRAAQVVGAVDMTPAAAEMWAAIYPELTTDYPGLFGSLVARAEAHTVRLALIYALADRKTVIEPIHLEAALAVWKYSEASARVLFGDMIGDPVADAIVLALKDAGTVGMSRRDLSFLFNRNVDASRIQQALHMLARLGRARMSRQSQPGKPGRPAEIWHFVPPARRP